MLENRETHEILGVRRNASRGEIEKKYTIFLKKYRASGSQDEKDAAEKADFEEITNAYNILMGYEEKQIEKNIKNPNLFMKKIGIDEKKAENFFFYYKYHMIFGIIILVFFIFTLKGCIERVNPDFTTAFIGQILYNSTDNEDLKQQIKAAVPEIKEPGFDGAFFSGDFKNEQDYAMQMKTVTLFAAGGIDLFILDKESFSKYGQQGAFVSFDDIADKLGVDKTKNIDCFLKTDDDKIKHLYGIDISNSKLLKDNKILGNKMIAAIPVNSKQQDKALKVLKLLLK